jgi:hypothetical protein
MASYYVATTGNNSNPGTISQPWRTIDYAVGGTSALGAGDTLYIRAGTYDEVVDVEVSGTSGNLITIRNYPGETPVMRDTANTRKWKWQVFDQSYLHIYGLKWYNYQGGALYIRAFNAAMTAITVEDCWFEEQEKYGTTGAHTLYFVATNASYPMTNIAAIGNTLKNNDTGTVAGAAPESLTATGHVTGYRCMNNTLENVTNIGINIIGRNSIGLPKEYIISGNTVRNNGTAWGDSIRAAAIYNDGAGGYGIIENNTLYDGTTGINVGCEADDVTTEHVIIRGNVVVDCKSNIKVGWGAAADTCGTGSTVRHVAVAHNTSYMTYNGAADGKSLFLCCADYLYIKNNIFVYYAPSGNYQIRYLNTTIDDSNWVLDYNLYHDTNSQWYQWDGTGYTTFAAYQSGSGQDANGMDSDPLFVDADNEDFRLSEGSPAIGSGDKLTKCNGSGSSSTSVTVYNSRYFSDGMGLQDGDRIIVGSNDPVTVTNVNYSTHVLTVDTAISWNDDDPVNYEYAGAGPNIGAEEPFGVVLPAAVSAMSAVVTPQILVSGGTTITPGVVTTRGMVVDPAVQYGVVPLTPTSVAAVGRTRNPSLGGYPPYDSSRMVKIGSLSRSIYVSQRERSQAVLFPGVGDILDYQLDLSQWLADDEEVVSATWTIPSGLTKGVDYSTESGSVCWIYGGTLGQEYLIKCVLHTSLNKIVEWAFKLRFQDYILPEIVAGPNDVLDYQLDWSGFLGSGDAISHVEWTFPVGLTAGTLWNNGDVTGCILRDAVDGSSYDVICKINSAGGRQRERAFTLVCEAWS